MSGVDQEMVPKAAFDALVQQISTLQATVDRLTAIIEEKNQIILNQNRTRFGQSSEKRTYGRRYGGEPGCLQQVRQFGAGSLARWKTLHGKA